MVIPKFVGWVYFFAYNDIIYILVLLVFVLLVLVLVLVLVLLVYGPTCIHSVSIGLLTTKIDDELIIDRTYLLVLVAVPDC